MNTARKYSYIDDHWDEWAKSFPVWSQSDFGFYVPRYWHHGRGQWITHKPKPKPVVWQPIELEALTYLFTIGEDGRLPHEYVYWLDIGKSAKSLKHAGVAQWMNMFHGDGAENILAANSKQHSQMRCWMAMVNSIEANPWKSMIIADQTREFLRFNVTNNLARAVPLKATTVAGGDFSFVGVDEMWGYEGKNAEDQIAEMKLSPGQNVRLFFGTSYPPFADSTGPLNKVLDDFFNEHDEPREDVHKVPGLEHLPLYVKGDYAVWWNREPIYPWHTKRFMDAQRDNPSNTQAQYDRIWRAMRVGREDAFIPVEAWEKCEDEELVPVYPLGLEKNVPMVVAVDLGLLQDSSAIVARGWNPILHRYDLLFHRSFYPESYKGQPPGAMIDDVKMLLYKLYTNHHVIAIGYDPRHAEYMAFQLIQMGVPMESLTQNSVRITADTHYQSLIRSRTLRNYFVPEMGEQIQSAVTIHRGDGAIRIDKSKTTRRIDLVVADSMTCHLVNKYSSEFDHYWRRKKQAKTFTPKKRPWGAIYGRT